MDAQVKNIKVDASVTTYKEHLKLDIYDTTKKSKLKLKKWTLELKDYWENKKSYEMIDMDSDIESICQS